MSVPSLTIAEDLDPRNQEENYVHNVYNEIASHFSQTRYKPWPIVEKFLNDQPDYAVGLDVGCGNGKYLNVNKKLYIIGSDRSDGLISCGQEISNNKYNLAVADGLSLPHPNETFDFAISIAVIHHFANEERRVDAISHILSKLKRGGQLLIYCWALEQEKSRRGYKEGDDQDILIPWVLQKKQSKGDKKHRKLSQKDSGESTEQNSNEVVTKQKDAEIKYRFYHLYQKGELKDNALKTGSCSVVLEGYEKDNWWIIVQKI